MRHRARFQIRAVAVVLFSIGLPLVALPQSEPGELRGRVTDTIGASLPGVAVTAFNEQGGELLTSTTDSSGSFFFAGLSTSLYRLDVQLAGFNSRRRNHVRIASGLVTVVDLTLNVGSLCECLGCSFPATAPSRLQGRVETESGWPVPFSRLEITDERGRYLDSAYADRDGRFVVALPDRGVWTLRSGARGFESPGLTMTRDTKGPVVLLQRYRDSVDEPSDEEERCCDSSACSLFTHAQRTLRIL